MNSFTFRPVLHYSPSATMENSTLILGVAAALLAVLLVQTLLQVNKAAGRRPLPPGPKGLPLLGNIRDLPQPHEFAAHQWLKHKDLYGPISSVTVLGKTVIIINDPQVAFELLDKRSAEFSSRPSIVFVGELVGWENSTGSLKYDDTLRLHRKVFSRLIGTKSTAAQYNTLKEAEVGHFLLHVLEDPGKLTEHIAKEAGSFILSITYGYNTEQFGRDPLLSMMNEAVERFANAAAPGTFLVDTIPMLRYVPDWFPGTGWKKLAKEWAADLRQTIDRPYKFVEQQMAAGKNNSSYLSRAIESNPDDVHNNKWTAASLFGGGADTTVASVAAFFLAMAKYPEVQKRAQQEIDEVVGSERLPNVDDREKLPYIDALVKETLRWHPIGPLSLPHASSKEAVYENYRIPEDSYLMPNIWWFTHDPEVYPDPMEFRPERFLQSPDHEPETDPRKFVFGFGRRICAGKLLAETSLYLNFAQSLAVFNIDKPVVDGKVAELKAEFLPGVISHPAPFNVSIKPRSPHHEKLIRAIEERFPWQKSDATDLAPIA